MFKKEWGIETYWGCVRDSYVAKTLQIDMKNNLPELCHDSIEKTIYITRGILNLELNDAHSMIKKEIGLGPGKSYHIQSGLRHTYSARNGDVCFVEVLSYCETEKNKARNISE